MRVTEIGVSAFGGLRNLRLELHEGMNTLLRPNGWGKTTLAAFIKAMLYGLSTPKGSRREDSERKKYMPWGGGTFGGYLCFESRKGSFRAERFFGARESGDSFCLYDLSTNLVSLAYSERLGEELFGIDAEAFARTVCISRRESLPNRGSETLTARLSALAEAADDVGDYADAMARLEKRSRAYLTTGNRGIIPSLEAELIAAEREREELLREHETLRMRERELAEIGREIARGEHEARRIRTALREAARSRESDSMRARRERLSGECSYLSGQLRALGGAKIPKDAQIKDARERLAEHRRLAERQERSREEPLPRRVPLLLPCVLLLSAAVMLAVGLLFTLHALVAVAVFLALSGVGTGILCGMRRHAYRLAREARERRARADTDALRASEQRLFAALAAIEAPALENAEDAIAAAEERKRQYRDMRNRLKTAEMELALFDLDHPLLAKPSERERGAERLSEREEAITARLSNLRAQAASMRAAAELLRARTEGLPETEQRLASMRAKLEAAREAHETLRETQAFLRIARESLSASYLDRMQRSLAAYLSQLSEERTEAFADASLALSVRTDTGTHSVSELSRGQGELLDFASRLSLADALFEDTEPPILILDDPFVHLDDAHFRAAKHLLRRLSARYQILYTVCREERR